MSLQSVGHFLLVQTPRGTTQGRYQNADISKPVVLEGANYNYLSFFYEGATRSRSGDNLQSEIGLANNPVSMAVAREAVEKGWLITVTTCAMQPRTLEVGRILTREVWLAASFTYNVEALAVILSSAIDAVGAQVPNRMLTSRLVGALPSTSQVQIR